MDSNTAPDPRSATWFAHQLGSLDARDAAMCVALLEETTAPRALAEHVAERYETLNEHLPVQRTLTRAGKKVRHGATRVGNYATGRGGRLASLTVEARDATRRIGAAGRARAEEVWGGPPIVERIARRTDELAAAHSADTLRRILAQRLSMLLGVLSPARIDDPDDTAWVAAVFRTIGAEYKVDGPTADIDRYATRVLDAILVDATAQARKQAQRLSPEEEDALVAAILKSFDTLTSDERDAVIGCVGIDEVSESTLRKALRDGSLFLGATAAISAAGFGAYLFAVQLVHAVFLTLLHLPLGFAVFKGTVMAVFFAHNPFVLGALALGGGGLLWHHQQRRFARRVGALAVLQVVTSAPPTPAARVV